MLGTSATVFGGIGLFLLGMILMTDGLKAVAGDALRGFLARFTGNRWSAVASGAGLTALVQSSSATTLATIGFVSAGLLSFNNAIGVIIGANLGTTSTGWIVALLGLKLSVSTLALPLIGIGALARLLGRDRLAQAGTALAGFGVIFVGIDVLQTGMADLSTHIDLSRYTVEGFSGRLMMVGVGVVMTVVMQSSSAAVATTLTALATGTVSFEQAAALVIGQNVGTTVTAALAAIGAQRLAQRTALVHVIFNLGTGTVALLLLPVFLATVDLMTETWIGDDAALSIAAFHTAFNLLGAAIFVPLIPRLARAAEWIVSEPKNSLERHLDPSLATVPALALDAGRRALDEIVIELVQALRARLSTGPGRSLVAIHEALEKVTRFIGQLPNVETQRLPDWSLLLQQLDDARRLARRMNDDVAMGNLLDSTLLAPQRAALRAVLDQYPAHSVSAALQGVHTRETILAQTAEGQRSVDESMRALSGQRLLEDMAESLSRLRHLQQPEHITNAQGQ